MPTPSATLVNLTATGDVVTGPGMPTNLVNGLPQACMGDLVTGAVCTGSVTVTTAVNMLTKGSPLYKSRLCSNRCKSSHWNSSSYCFSGMSKHKQAGVNFLIFRFQSELTILLSENQVRKNNGR